MLCLGVGNVITTEIIAIVINVIQYEIFTKLLNVTMLASKDSDTSKVS